MFNIVLVFDIGHLLISSDCSNGDDSDDPPRPPLKSDKGEPPELGPSSEY